MSESPWTTWPERGPDCRSTMVVSVTSTRNFKLGNVRYNVSCIHVGSQVSEEIVTLGRLRSNICIFIPGSHDVRQDKHR